MQHGSSCIGLHRRPLLHPPFCRLPYFPPSHQHRYLQKSARRCHAMDPHIDLVWSVHGRTMVRSVFPRLNRENFPQVTEEQPFGRLPYLPTPSPYRGHSGRSEYRYPHSLREHLQPSPFSPPVRWKVFEKLPLCRIPFSFHLPLPSCHVAALPIQTEVGGVYHDSQSPCRPACL